MSCKPGPATDRDGWRRLMATFVRQPARRTSRALPDWLAPAPSFEGCVQLRLQRLLHM